MRSTGANPLLPGQAGDREDRGLIIMGRSVDLGFEGRSVQVAEARWVFQIEDSLAKHVGSSARLSLGGLL